MHQSSTTLRNKFRNRTSNLWKSGLDIVRRPAVKGATGEIIASKHRSTSWFETFLSHNVARWQRNAFDAACRWWSTSCRFKITLGIFNRISDMNLFFVLRPAGVDKNDGRHHRSFVSVKKKRTWDKETTNSFKKKPASMYMEYGNNLQNVISKTRV